MWFSFQWSRAANTMAKVLYACTIILLCISYSKTYSNKSSANVCTTAGPRTFVRIKRIVDGRDASAHSWPWMGLLQMWNVTQKKFVQWCDAILVHQRFVTTAAHCMFFGLQNLTDFRVRLGDHDRSVTEPSEQEFAVVRKTLHPEYNNFADNDVAVLELDHNAQLNAKVGLACLPSQDVDPSMSLECYVTGWGSLSTTGPKANILQEARLPLAPRPLCAQAAQYFKITSNMLCAGSGPKSKVSGCIGDSGGPLNCYDRVKNQWIVHGSLTGGTGHCGATYTVFARLNRFREWIDCQVGNSGPPLGCNITG